MSASQDMPPRKSVPAPQPTLLQRLREIVTSPNAIRTASVAAFFVIWEYLGRRMDPIFMAPPSAIFEAALQLIQSGALNKALVQTLWPFTVGMVLTVIVGIALGIVMAQWRTLEYVLDPFINALYAIPRIALVPLIILWAGLEFAGKVTILVSVAIFPITVNTYAGIRDVRGSMLEIGRAYGATEWQIFWKIILPAAIPFIMAGIRPLGGPAIVGSLAAALCAVISGVGGVVGGYSIGERPAENHDGLTEIARLRHHQVAVMLDDVLVALGSITVLAHAACRQDGGRPTMVHGVISRVNARVRCASPFSEALRFDQMDQRLLKLLLSLDLAVEIRHRLDRSRSRLVRVLLLP